MKYKADCHVHSKYSNKPTIWALRKFNCPESFTSPRYIYKRAKERGMDYVTITDHNSINGVLEIAHLRYVRELTDDNFMEEAAWNYIVWFYSLMDEITVPSNFTGRQLMERGIDADKIKPLPRIWIHSLRP